MDPQAFIDYMQNAFYVSVMLAMPILGTAMAVGIVVSVLQTITSIQEQTLVFVPKMLGVLGALVVCFTFMLRTIMNFSIAAFQMISQVSP